MTDSRHTGFPDEEFVDDSAAFPDEEGEQGGLYEHFSVVADKGQTLLRLDKFLVARMEHCSRNRIQAAADSGNILVNGVPAKSSYKVKPLDRVQIVLPYPRRDNEIHPEAIPLEIPYEDDDLLLVNKQAGMVVHPGVGNWSGTLVNALAHHLRGTEIADSGEMRAGLVHRIDKDTSGPRSSPRTSRPTPGWPSSSSTTPSTGVTWPWSGATSPTTREPSSATSGAAPASGRKCMSSRTAPTASMP